MVFLRFIRIKNDECDDLHMQKCIQLQKLYFIAQSGKLDSILSVKDFNEWFNSDKDPEIYAHKGIFLRLDKLSQQHIDSYVQYETEGLLGYGDFNWVTMKKFENEIIEDWQNKLRQNDEEREESN
jgi:hypothetical protein